MSVSSWGTSIKTLFSGKSWKAAWRSLAPADVVGRSYDVIVIGGGAHGLASAYYLAKNHGITNVLVVEKGWLGGGNTARNTTIIRSDYFLEASGRLKDFALDLWRDLGSELQYNLMVSQRGYVDLAHSDGELEAFQLRANAMRLRGRDARVVGREELVARLPGIDLAAGGRFPIVGALIQESGGVLRHDAVTWGYATVASRLGVDIVENCAVTGLKVEGGRIRGVETVAGEIACGAALISVAGHSSLLAAMAGFSLPIESIAVQAFVTEPVKPVLDAVVNFNAGLAYVSQTDKGEILMGGTTEGYNSYAGRGSWQRVEEAAARCCALFPFIAKLRLMRSWGGIADIAMDGNAIMGECPVDGLYLNAGWGYAGFKATPAVGWCLANSIAQGLPDPLISPFALERFASGALIDDAGAGPAPHLH